MSYHTIPYHTIPYHTIPYHIISYHISYHRCHIIPYYLQPCAFHILTSSFNSDVPAAPSSVNVQSIQARTVEVKWNTPAQDPAEGSILSHILKYHIVGSPNYITTVTISFNPKTVHELQRENSCNQQCWGRTVEYVGLYN